MKDRELGDYRIPLEEVMADMMKDEGIVSHAARAYFYKHYADDKTRKRMDREDKIKSAIAIGAMAILASSLVWTLVTAGQ